MIEEIKRDADIWAINAHTNAWMMNSRESNDALIKGAKIVRALIELVEQQEVSLGVLAGELIDANEKIKQQQKEIERLSNSEKWAGVLIDNLSTCPVCGHSEFTEKD